MAGGTDTGYDLMRDSAAVHVRFGSKLALLAGFGGLLLLIALAGADSVRVLRTIEQNHRSITESYLAGRHAMDTLQQALWHSGSLVRDYVLQSDPVVAEEDLSALRRLRQEMEEALRKYAAEVPQAQESNFAELRADLDDYWQAMAPALRWTAQERKSLGYGFLTGEVFPRREAVLQTAGKIDALNELALQADDRRSAALFASFRRRAFAVLALSLSAGLALAGVAVSRILRLERDARWRYQEIVTAREELQRLSASLVQSQEEERRAISRELHDEVGQSLSALLVDLGNLAAAMPHRDHPELAQMLGTARNLAETSVQAVRNMSLLLRPSMLDDFGLVPALNWQAREVSRRSGMRVVVSADGIGEDLSDRLSTCIYRVAQAALVNCERHSEARTVWVTVRQTGSRLALTIADDGKGFDSRKIRGLGLLGMAERVSHQGGEFEVESEPGQGTVIKVDLPVEVKDGLARAEEV